MKRILKAIGMFILLIIVGFLGIKLFFPYYRVATDSMTPTIPISVLKKTIATEEITVPMDSYFQKGDSENSIYGLVKKDSIRWKVVFIFKYMCDCHNKDIYYIFINLPQSYLDTFSGSP